MLPGKSIQYFCMQFSYFMVIKKNIYFFAYVFKIILIVYWELLMV